MGARLKTDIRSISSLKSLVFIGVLLVLSYLAVLHEHEIRSAFIEHFNALVYAVVLSMAAISLQTLNFLQLIEVEEKPAFFRTLRMWGVANLSNYLGPLQPGIAVRIAYFRGEGIPVTLALQTTLTQLGVSVWVGMGVMLAGMLSDISWIRLISLCSGLIFIMAPILDKQLHRIVVKGSPGSVIPARIVDFLSSIRLHVPAGKLWPFFGQYLLTAASFWGVYGAFGAPLEIHQALLLSVATLLSTLVSVTPNNLGVQEIILGYVAHLGGLSEGDALSVALVFRVSHLVSCATLIALTTLYIHLRER